MGETLVLVHRIPFPPDRGDKIRSWHMIREIAKHGRVHLACFADDEADAAHIEGLRAALGDRLGEVHVAVRSAGRAAAALKGFATGRPMLRTMFDSKPLQDFVTARLADPAVSAVFAYSVQMAQFVPVTLRQRFVMDFVDVDSAKYAAYGAEGGAMAWLYRREGKLLLAYEAEVASRADAGLFVSEAEAALFRRLTGAAKVQGMSNGIDARFFDPATHSAQAELVEALSFSCRAAKKDSPKFIPSDAAGRVEGTSSGRAEVGDKPMLLFTGQMDYRPNIDAVRWFAAEVMPRLGDVHFVIAGRAPTDEVQALAAESITVTGPVDDMRAWLAAADLVVAPLRIARGIQNKVLEAMAMGRPVVASPGAFEGIEAEPGRHLRIADDAGAWVTTITELLSCPAAAATMGQAARDLITSTYGWDDRLAPLAGLLGLTETKVLEAA